MKHNRFKIGDKVQYVGSDLKTLLRKDYYYMIETIEPVDEFNSFYGINIRINDQHKVILVHEHTLIKV